MAEWSRGRRAQLQKITSRLLKENPEPDVVDLITVVLAYERLVTEHPDELNYRLKLREAIDSLATHVLATGRAGQASRLKSLAQFQNHQRPDLS